MNSMYNNMNNQMYSFQPMGNNPYFNKYIQPQTPTNGINWVQGIEGAKAYQLPPNSNIVLLDSDNAGVFYIKTSDNVGMCNLRIFSYVETTGQATTQQTESIDMSQFVTRSELDEILKNMNGGKANGKRTLSRADEKSIISE